MPGAGAAVFQPTCYVSTKAGKDTPLVERIVALSGKHLRYGHRRVWTLLRREGWKVNKKCVQRLWREADSRCRPSYVNEGVWDLP
jgi:hypothetical protein